MRLLLCCAMSAGLFLSACSATQPVRPDKAGSIAPTQTVVVIRGLEGEGDVQRAPPAVVRRLEVEERNNRYLGRLQAVRVSEILCERHTMMLPRSMYATQEEDAGGHARH